jgi:hypothetical protein
MEGGGGTGGEKTPGADTTYCISKVTMAEDKIGGCGGIRVIDAGSSLIRETEASAKGRAINLMATFYALNCIRYR